MLKESTYPLKYQMIKHCLPSLILSIRRDLRQDHLKKDKAALKEYFQGKNPNKLTVEELAEGYAPLLEGGNEDLWEFIAERWLLKHTDVYYFFEEKLKEIDEEFTSLEEIELEKARSIADESVRLFGAEKTLIFGVLNEVVFPKEIYNDLEKAAKEAPRVHEKPENILPPQDYSAEIKRLENKYEKKLLGLQKKYERDVAALKKQVSALQKKLAAQS